MRPLVVLALVATLAFLPTSATAHHCSGYSTSPAVEAAGLYVNPGFDARLYQETNGIPGLQRRDAGHDDTCHGSIAPDTRIV